jgi:hypothetical protein
MSSYSWSYEKVVEMLQDARPVVAINGGFERSLRAYALANHDVYLAQQLLLRSRIRGLKDLRSRIKNNTAALTRFDGRSSVTSSRPTYNRAYSAPAMTAMTLSMGTTGYSGNKRSFGGVSDTNDSTEGKNSMDDDSDANGLLTFIHMFDISYFFPSVHHFRFRFILLYR